jgi:hypothetical protein
MALMYEHRELSPMPDCAIFANTQWEPAKVYEHLAWLKQQLSYPVYEVTAGDLRQAVLDRRNTAGGRYAAIPWFTVNPDGSHGMGRRQCTSEYKLKPIMHKLRELLGVSRRARIRRGAVEVLIGISTDEASRMKPARQQWQHNSYPLIGARMSRIDCGRWLWERYRRQAPKSACCGCPFHDVDAWIDQRDNAPDEWADTIEIDRQMRLGNSRGMRAIEYMHPQRVPLEFVDLTSRRDNRQLNLFDNECEGMCGL